MLGIAATPAAPDMELPLGRLRDAVTVTPGQKIAYIADAAENV